MVDELTLGPARIDYDLPPFGIAQLRQAFLERYYCYY
jgi:hypothetical protein